jgi:hypothetical protein
MNPPANTPDSNISSTTPARMTRTEHTAAKPFVAAPVPKSASQQTNIVTGIGTEKQGLQFVQGTEHASAVPFVVKPAPQTPPESPKNP